MHQRPGGGIDRTWGHEQHLKIEIVGVGLRAHPLILPMQNQSPSVEKQRFSGADTVVRPYKLDRNRAFR